VFSRPEVFAFLRVATERLTIRQKGLSGRCFILIDVPHLASQRFFARYLQRVLRRVLTWDNRRA
jgi:hypothetical protein